MRRPAARHAAARNGRARHARTRRARARRAGARSREEPIAGAVLGAAVALAACGAPAPLVIADATLIDGTGSPPLEGARVVVADDRIACVGRAADCPTPDGADVLDAAGFWVAPGLIDADMGSAPPDIPSERRAVLRFLLGVTTAGDADFDFEAEALAGAPSEDPRRGVPRRVRTGNGTVEVVPFQMVLEMARREPEALDDLALELAGREVALAPGLLALELGTGPYRLPIGLHRLLELPMVTEAIQTGAEEPTAADSLLLERVRAFVRRFHEAGGSVFTASGGVLTPGLAIHEEMAALVRAGLAPAEALGAATVTAARALGVADSRGTVEEGKLGDLILLEGDPTADIANAQLVSRVVKGGALHDPAYLFDALLEDPGERVTGGGLRLGVGLAAVLVALGALAYLVRRHRRSLPESWRS